MCCSSLSTVRRTIGKNTRFKEQQYSHPSSSRRVPVTFVFLSFTVLAAAFLVSSSSSLHVDDVDVLSKLVFKAQTNSHRGSQESVSEQFVRFAGNRSSVSDRPRIQRDSPVLPQNALNDKQRSKSQYRNIIQNHAIKYKQLAADLQFVETVPTHTNADKESSSENSSTYNNKTIFHGRSRRDVIFAEAADLTRRRRKSFDHEDEGTFVIRQVTRTTPQYYDTKNAIDINCQRIGSNSFVFSIEESNEGRTLMFHKLDDQSLKQELLFRTAAPDAVSVDVFEIKQQLFAFTTINHGPQSVESSDTINTGSILYKVNQNTNTFEKTQTIHLPFAKSTAFWSGSGEEANDLFLAIAPEKAVTENGFTYDVMIACYRWQGGYFDFVSQVPARNPQAIQQFDMFSHDYLAVANYQDDTGSTNIQSEIFRYNHKEARFVSFQKIQTYGAKHIRHFTFESPDGKRQEHFVAIANHCKKDENGRPQFWTQSTIMKFSGIRFIPFKSIYANGAQQFAAVKDEKRFFLAMATLQGIYFFQYNGWTFVQTAFQEYDHQQKSPFSITLRQLNNNDKSYFTVASSSQGVQNGMYSVEFETKNDHRKLVSSVKTWCTEASKLIGNKDLSAIEGAINEAPKVTDDKVVVKGSITFTNNVNVANLQSLELKLSGRSLGDDEFRRLAASEKHFGRILRHMEAIKTGFTNVVWTNRDSVIEGDVMFENIVYHNPSLQVQNLKVDKLASRNLPTIVENLIFLNQPQAFNSIKCGDVSALDLTPTAVNGHSLEDYALQTPSIGQVFTGTNQFASNVVVTNSVNVGSTFAGLPFTQPNFLLTVGNQTFPGATMKLSRSGVSNLYTRILNGHDMFFYFNDAVPLSGGTIQGDKKFKSVLARRASVTFLNNVNINDLYSNAVYTDGRPLQSFTGATYFEKVIAPQVTPANSALNEEFNLATDFIQIKSGRYELQKLDLSQGTDIQELFVIRQLNNIQVNEGKLDILFANIAEPQHVKSKTLNAIRFLEHVEAEELVDGVHLSSWSNVQEIKLHHNVISGNLHVNGMMTATKNLQASHSFLQGTSDVLNVLQKSAPLDAERLPGSGPLNFEGLVVQGNSEIVGAVNGIQPSQWVINDPSQQLTITAKKIFESGLHLSNDIKTNGLYGSVDPGAENLFSVLPNLLLDGIDQQITQSMAFLQSFKVNNAECLSTVLDNVAFEDILFKKGSQTVEVNSVFRQPLIARGPTSAETVSAVVINGVNIAEQLPDTLRTSGVAVQRVTSDYSFTQLSAQSSEVAGTLASSDINSLMGNIVTKNSQEMVTLEGGHLSFNSGATMDMVEFIGHINGIHSSDWGEKWLMNVKDQVITTKVQFVGAVEATSVQAPSVNGISVEELATQIVRTDQNEVMKGSVSFLTPATLTSGITMLNEAILNGIDLRRDVLLKSSQNLQTITGEKRFLGGMTVKEDLVASSISGFDMNNFAKLLSSKTETGDSLLINGNLNVAQEPMFQSRINEHSWEGIMNEIWLRDKRVTLANPVQFSSLHLAKGGELADSARLNGVDLPNLLANYASKTRNQEWTGVVTLQQVDKADRIASQSLILDNGGLLNGINVHDFSLSVLRYSGDQSVHGALKSERLQTGRLDAPEGAPINSVSVPQGLLMVHGGNHLTGTKTFDNIKAQNVVLSPGTEIDGVNLGHWNENAVTRTGNHKITGHVQFAALQTKSNVNVKGLVDGMKYDVDNILTTDLDQTVLGHVTIRQSDKVPSTAALTATNGVLVEGSLNGINVNEKISQLVFNDKTDSSPIIIKGETVFEAPVVLNQVKSEGLIGGQDMSSLVGTLKRAHEEMEKKNFKAQERYANLLTTANKMMTVTSNRAVFLDHYVLTQVIKAPAAYVKVFKSIGYPAIAFGFKESPLITTETWYSYNSAVDYYQRQIGNRVQMEGTVTDIAELGQGKDHLFVYAVNTEGNGRPAQAALEVMNSANNFEVDKSPEKLSKTFLLKFVDRGTPNFRPAISHIIYGDAFKSVQAFSVTPARATEFTSCLATTSAAQSESENSVKIFCLDNASGSLNMVQNLNFESPSLTISMTLSKKTALGFLTRSNVKQPEGLLEIWSESQSRESSGSLIQFAKLDCLPVFNVVSMDALSTSDGKTFLAVASGSMRETGYQGYVFMYSYSQLSRQFKKIQTLEVSHPIDVKLQLLQPSKEILAYVLSQSLTNNVQVYKYKGLSKWINEHTFTADAGTSLHVTDFDTDGMYRAQLLVTSPLHTYIYAAEFTGLSRTVEEVMEFEKENFVDLTDIDNI